MSVSAVLVGMLVLSSALAPLAADAEQGPPTARIGVLGNRPNPWTDALRQQLRELGWVEGRNLVVEYRWAEGKFERLPELAADLVRLKVDLVVAQSSMYVEAARKVTSTTPIVFSIHADPIGSGHVASLAHPGGMITGVAQLQTELLAKGLQLLKEAVPTARRVAVLWNPDTPSHVPGLRAVEATEASLGLTLVKVAARNAPEFEGAFATMTGARASAVLVLTSPGFDGRRLADLALKHRLPSMFGFKEAVEAGGLLSYGANYTDAFRRAATYIDRILKGARPADLPVEQVTTFELAVNLKTGKTLGLTLPQSLLLRATDLIQ